MYPLLTVSYAQSCLIADFPFNGNAIDASGNGNNGTVSGATLTTGHDGVANSAYFFDAVNDEIIMNNVLGNFGTSDYTISCWLKTILQSGTARFLSKRSACTNGTFYNLGVKNSEFEFEAQDNSDQIGGWSTIPVNDGNWHHIAVVRSGELFSFFINGYLEFAEYSGYVFDSDNNANLRIGDDVCVGVSTSVKFTGSLDDIKFFDCALNAIEIAQLINDTAGCTV
ncbi:MAG: LamG domain-containing protein, partial [Bacteroidota bacterium]|nr:LamG domain-containing protein [Bacteroidota bacterium]